MLEGTSPVLRREGSRKAPDLSDYNAHLLEVLHQKKMAIWLESSLQIKQAGGMQPHRRTGGKTDKVDAQPVRRRGIAQYAYRFRDQIRLWEPPREIIQKLAFLTGPPLRCHSPTTESGRSAGAV